MAQYIQIHPENPQERLIQQAVNMLHEGAVIVYPTDSAYALGCHMGDHKALERIRKIRELTQAHHFTLVCKDLKDLGTYAQIDNSAFRMLKSLIPGAFTFLLKATREVPKRLLHTKRKTIGLRVPDNKISQMLLAALGEPLMSTTLILPEQTLPMVDPYDIQCALDSKVDLIIDGGNCGFEPTTVIDLIEWPPVLIRQGKGNASEYFE
ncbi:MAG: threonylcarbamoyl-AMP synthase [Legionellales bacterium]|nr:threonylcarbamoyl-AMP synthase [Legionellales bacterium]|tara:strand:- start:647 stop:1270 length:624 start_codon:yes stop_codon:yes gene_type:complete